MLSPVCTTKAGRVCSTLKDVDTRIEYVCYYLDKISVENVTIVAINMYPCINTTVAIVSNACTTLICMCSLYVALSLKVIVNTYL